MVASASSRASAEDAHHDRDEDGLPDDLELGLAIRYFPDPWMTHWHADVEQAYWYHSDRAPVPFTVARILPREPGAGICTEPFQCLEIRFGLAYSFDCGDGLFLRGDRCDRGDRHQGDSETYAVMVARSDPDTTAEGGRWGTPWEVARADASRWRMILDFGAAHWTALTDSSWFRAHGVEAQDGHAVVAGTDLYQRLEISERKHGAYPDDAACDAGGLQLFPGEGFDECDSRFGTRRYFAGTAGLANMGSASCQARFATEIPYPGDTPSAGPSRTRTYRFWSGEPFGELGGGGRDYRSHFERNLDWLAEYCRVRFADTRCRETRFGSRIDPGSCASSANGGYHSLR